MKLGIVVVYLVSERNEKLLDLHLSQIEKNTCVPYTIYGSANRLLPQFRHKLEQHPEVKICDCVPTDLRSGFEHSFYLDQLVRFAVEDGATHIVSLHVDSFPIRVDWVEELASKLSNDCVLTAIMRGKQYGQNDCKPLAACLFFSSDFYLKYRPTFLLSESELASPEYRRYRQKWEHTVETGVGYGFKIFAAGLSWYPLLKSNKVDDYPEYGNVYGDLMFHLGEAAWRPYFHGEPVPHPSNWRSNLKFVSLLRMTKDRIKPMLPVRSRKLFTTSVEKMIVTPMYEHIRQQLLDDPETYLDYLRTGKRQSAKRTTV
jgi:hypothetical protein